MVKVNEKGFSLLRFFHFQSNFGQGSIDYDLGLCTPNVKLRLNGERAGNPGYGCGDGRR